MWWFNFKRFIFSASSEREDRMVVWIFAGLIECVCCDESFFVSSLSPLHNITLKNSLKIPVALNALFPIV